MQARKLAIAIVTMLGAAACTPVDLGISAGMHTASALSRSDGPVAYVSDASIRMRINARWLGNEDGILVKVGLLVHSGRVILTGYVPTQDMRLEAERLVWNVGGVEEVVNAIRVGAPSSIASQGRDALIVQQIKAGMLVDAVVRSSNYEVDAVDGVVYLLGTARSEEEMQRVVARASDVSYVRDVVNHIRVWGQLTS